MQGFRFLCQLYSQFSPGNVYAILRELYKSVFCSETFECDFHHLCAAFDVALSMLQMKLLGQCKSEVNRSCVSVQTQNCKQNWNQMYTYNAVPVFLVCNFLGNSSYTMLLMLQVNQVVNTCNYYKVSALLGQDFCEE